VVSTSIFTKAARSKTLAFSGYKVIWHKNELTDADAGSFEPVWGTLSQWTPQPANYSPEQNLPLIHFPMGEERVMG
jgi:hypothetical protein